MPRQNIIIDEVQILFWLFLCEKLTAAFKHSHTELVSLGIH